MDQATGNHEHHSPAHVELIVNMKVLTCLGCLPVSAFPQALTMLDPGVGPQPVTGFQISVPTAPITANFSFFPTSGSWPLTVQFVDLTQGGPGGWTWTFGDGGSSTGQNPIHTFQSASNTWTVNLTATGPGGSSSTNRSILVTNSIDSVLVSWFPVYNSDFPDISALQGFVVYSSLTTTIPANSRSNFATVSATSLPLNGFQFGSTYYFSVTEIGTNGVESDPTTLVPYTIPTP